METSDAPGDGDEPVGPAIRSAWLRIAIFIAVFLAVQAVGAVIPVGILAALDPGFLENIEIGTLLTRHLLLVTITATIPGIAMVWFFWTSIDHRRRSALLPLHGRTVIRAPADAGSSIGKPVAAGLATAVVLMILVSLPTLILNRDHIRFLPAGATAFLLSLPAFLVTFALVALNEELSIRGYVLKNLMEKVGPWSAVGISSVLFAALHIGNPNLKPVGYLNLNLAGAFLGFSVLRWGSLWYAIAFHFAWNLFQAVIVALPVSGVRVKGLIDISNSGPAWLTGGAFGPEGSVLTTAILIAACAAMARRPRIAENGAAGT